MALPPCTESDQGAPPADTTPPWMLEMKKKRQSRPTPRGETEKLAQEKQPETPAWMKDALAKKKRATQVMQAKQGEGQGHAGSAR